MSEVYKSGPIELRCGQWQSVLADVEMVDAVITDPPYSERTHDGYRTATDFGELPVASNHDKKKREPGGSRVGMPRTRFELQYAPLKIETVREAVATLRPRKWWVVFGDHVTASWWSAELEAAGYLVFAPVVWVRLGSAPRFFADGTANSCEWITVARPRQLPADRFSRPGHYLHPIHGEKVVTGGKPIDLMRKVVRDYSEPGDLILEPCAGGATTLLAAAMEGRRAIGAEMDPETYRKAVRRLSAGYTPPLFTERKVV